MPETAKKTPLESATSREKKVDISSQIRLRHLLLLLRVDN